MKDSILLIEDDRLMRITLEDALKASGYRIASFEKGEDALAAFRREAFDVVVTDIRLPDIDGLSILRAIKREKDTQVLVITAFGNIEDAVNTMKEGAFDYITKPFPLDHFLLLIERALELKRLREQNTRLLDSLGKCHGFQHIVGESAEIKKIYALIEKVAEADSTILISGESGTGKELIATTIHYRSTRSSKHLIKVNCAALPESLVESELFGHEEGAFTGAIRQKPGRFELADRGTLFLDEIADLPAPTQIKLLRVLQDGSFERVGGTETLKVDVRVIAATNRKLLEMVEEGLFREDLYYRLNVIPVFVPPLRERVDDILLLVNYFLERYKARFNKNVTISAAAMKHLLAYSFPGNVRELENILERCIILAEGATIRRDDLPNHIVKDSGAEDPGAPLSKAVADAEREHIVNALRRTGGHKGQAAEALDISRKTLWEKMKAYGIES
jgi:two-component system response regulator AtoC